ncbi:hypothetical protein LR48_Vigan707s001800 [Vigna angularis]|uniref:Uncharacterized protein n=1 Tax=Phaseolus angularis TaxID=3914 RepID=A0A0L9TG96_PHAAN|nr:hypothetical protein LR48_Vigan707s001800 [Vigna angularis]
MVLFWLKGRGVRKRRQPSSRPMGVKAVASLRHFFRDTQCFSVFAASFRWFKCSDLFVAVGAIASMSSWRKGFLSSVFTTKGERVLARDLGWSLLISFPYMGSANWSYVFANWDLGFSEIENLGILGISFL